MESVDGNTERIMERVRQRNIELNVDLDKDKENKSSGSFEQRSEKSAPDLVCDGVVNSDVRVKSPMNNKTNDNVCEMGVAPATREKASRMRSRFLELAAEYEQFEVDQNWQQTGSKPKEAYMKGISPRLSIGETRPSVLCTPAGMTHLKSSTIGNSCVNSEKLPLETVSTVCNETSQKTEPLREETRRIQFADPIADTQVLEYESSMCSTMNTADESSIVAGCGVRDTSHVLPVPSARKFLKNMHGEVDLSTDEYGAHTFTKKVLTETSVKDDDEQVDMSSDEYGAHTFLKKKTPAPPKCTSASSLAIMSPKPFNPIKTSSPNCQTRTITMHTKMTAEIPLFEANHCAEENQKDSMDQEKPAKIATSSFPMTSPSSKRVSEETEDAQKNKLSPIRSAAVESAKAKKIAQQLEQRLKNDHSKIPTPKPLILAPTAVSATPVTPTTTNVQTQWRGSCNTPVVVGAVPGVPTQPDVRASNLKKLKTRWEFSSMTGTPIHPDETEDDILKAAIRMRDMTIPPRKFSDKPKDPQPYLASRISQSIKVHERPQSGSPVSKSLRYVDEFDEDEVDGKPGNCQKMSVLKTSYSPYKSPAIKFSTERSPKITNNSPMRQECPDTKEETNLFDGDKASADEVNVSHNVSDLIDRAFEFMDVTPNRSSGDATAMGCGGVAPKAEEEQFSPMKHLPNMLPISSDSNCDYVYNQEEDSSRSNSCEMRESCNGGSQLPYTVSFYRKRLREIRAADSGVEKIDLTTQLAATPIQTVLGSGTYNDVEESQSTREERRAEMEREVSVQQQRIAQATHALRYCKQQTEFRGSREEVDAQRALLIATETRRALLFEIDRLSRGDSKRGVGPRGTLTITNITIFLDPDFVGSQINHTCNRDDIYYFIVLLRHGCDVQHTSLITSDEAIRKKGLIEFDYYLSLKDLPPDFICVLEVYGLRTKREHISHEVKYRLTGTMNKKQRSKFSSVMKTSSGGPSAVIDPAFQLIGRLTIDINTQSRKLTLQDVLSPLEGTVIVKMKKHSTDKSRTINRGFLSMYQRTNDGLGTWTRYWCVLQDGEMRFWRSPDEERAGKQWLVLLDLQTCASDGASTVRDVCPYPNSFHIDVWVPKESSVRQGPGKPELEKLRVMLAADTKAHLDSWLEVINETARHILMWDRPVSISK